MKRARKRRQRTSQDIPAKGRLKDMADQLWSLAVREDWAWKCAVCGFMKVEAHHLIPRQNEATRYSLLNGIALCTNHHKFDAKIAPHQNAAGWLQWLSKYHENQHRWYIETVAARQEFQGTKTALYYCDVIRRLRQYVEPEEFERVCGIRFSQWLESQ